MADNYLITGYWGEPHVTAENDRGINAAMFGAGRFVLPVGEQFRAEYIGNNTIRIYDGKLMDNGAAGGIPVGEFVDLLIANAGQGMKRNDLIVFQYSQDASTLIESGVFTVIQGAETDGTASDPKLTQEDLLSGEATFDQMALWRIPVAGTTISEPVKLFSVWQNNTSHASNKNNPHDVTAEQVGARPSTWMPSAEDVGASPMEYTKKVGNPHNLLNNSDFRNPVNQRGLAKHVVSSGYTVDRWYGYHTGGNLHVSPQTGYVKLWAENKTGNITFFQRFEKGVLDLSKKYTLAYKKASGGIVIDNNPVIEENSFDFIQIAMTPNQTLNLVWAALYEGEYTAETLPEYQPKGYAAELAECQRYAMMLGKSDNSLGYPVVVGIGSASDTSNAFIQCPIPTKMRVNPTVIIDGAVELLNKTCGSYASIGGISAYIVQPNNLVWLQVSATSSLVAGDMYSLTCRNGSGYILLSADL